MKTNKFTIYKKAFGEKNMDRLAYGERLGTVMTAKRKTIVELRELLGVSYEMARRYATGAGRPSWDKNVKIADWLGLSPDWLAYGDGNQAADGEPLTVPLFKLSDRSIDEPDTAEKQVMVPQECSFVVVVDNKMAPGFNVGDHLYCKRTESFDADDSVLLKAIDKNAFVPNTVRKVVFGLGMQPIFKSDNPGHPDLTLETYKPIAKVVASLRKENPA